MSSSDHSAAWPFDDMASPKPIPFEQVRVRTDLANQAPLCGRNRPSAGARGLAVFQWSRLSNIDPVVQTNRAPVGTDLLPENVLSAQTPAERQLLPPLPLPPHDGDVPQGALFEAVPQPKQALHDAGPSPPPLSGDASTPGREPADVPVRAVVRSLRQAVVLRGLSGTIAKVCDGEENQRLGPWEMTLPLSAHGLGRSFLNMRLSLGELLLRFQCDGKDKLDLISAGAEGLRTELEETLRPPLEVRIETTLW